MLRRTPHIFINATAIHAIYAIPDRCNTVRIARIARVQIATPVKTAISAGEVAYD